MPWLLCFVGLTLLAWCVIHRRRAAPLQRVNAVPDDLEDGVSTAATAVHFIEIHAAHSLHAAASVAVERPHQD